MKLFYLLLSCLLPTLALQAQPPGAPREEQIEALRVAFLTRHLQLTPDEAKVFWPVHDAYQKDMRKLAVEHRQKNGDELELEEKILALRKKYKPDFLKAISEEKFNKMLRAEKEFREVLRKELERRRANNPGGGGRMGPRRDM